MAKVMLPNRPIGPFPVILIGADVDGRPNYATVGACGVVSLEPVLYASLRKSHYTTAGIKQNGFFSVNIPPVELVGKTDFCGTVSGKDTDKSGVFTAFYDEAGRAPLIGECPLNLLCQVVESIPVSDFEMFFGRIVAVYVNEECLTGGQPDPGKTNPLVMMGQNYWKLGPAAGALFQEGAAYKKAQRL